MKSLEERFWEKVEKQDGCWLWTSAVGGSMGYGVFWVGGPERSKYAHRVSWEIHNCQTVPPGGVVMHSCDNPLCVNPGHLSIGTAADNNEDRRLKRRHCYGENNLGGGKLNWDKAREIRVSPVGCLRLSRQYGVSSTTIKAIRRNKIWKAELDPLNQ